jgi:hypothetical protein
MCVPIVGLGEPIENPCWTMILDWTHVLADRLGVEHAVVAFGQQHQPEDFLAVARAYSGVDDLPVTSGLDHARGELRAEVELDRGRA